MFPLLCHCHYCHAFVDLLQERKERKGKHVLRLSVVLATDQDVAHEATGQDAAHEAALALLMHNRCSSSTAKL
jgi:hypothetical protein